MKVVVGSTNKGKIEAVKTAFEKVFPNKKLEVVGIKVDSGVSHQPKTIEEGLLGARTRAKNALEKVKADFGVGAEGGIYQADDVYLESGWIVVIDKKGNEGVGSSPHLLVAPKMLEYIEQGLELTDAAGKVLKKAPDKEKEGYFGHMTNNIITRITGYSDGVVMALARFIHPELFEEEKKVKVKKEKVEGIKDIPESFGKIAPAWRESKKTKKNPHK